MNQILTITFIETVSEHDIGELQSWVCSDQILVGSVICLDSDVSIVMAKSLESNT